MSGHSALDMLLSPGGLTPLYQPIFRFENGVPLLYGFEALTRGPAGTNFHSATVLFDYARLKRQEIALDRVCIATALEHMPGVADHLRLSVNAHASTIGRDPSFPDFLAAAASEYGIALERLTVEIVEHAPPWDTDAFDIALARLRERGVKIALDDVGLGLSNFKMLLDVNPDFLKIDRYLVDGCHEDSRRAAIIASLASISVEFGATVIAEGVERVADLETVRALGVQLVQGFLVGKPISAAEVRELALAPQHGLLGARASINPS